MEVFLTFQVKGFLGNKNDIYLLLEMRSYLLLKMFMKKLTSETEKETFLSLQKKLPKRQIKNWSAWSDIGALKFLSNFWKILVKELLFDNAACYRPVALLKRELFLKLTKTLLIIVGSLWTSCSIKKNYMRTFALT